MQPSDKGSKAVWPTTHWSVVGRAGNAGAEERRLAVTSILQSYSPALSRHLINCWHVKRDQIDDLVQEFVLSKILVDNIIEAADRNRGKFRSFLAVSFDNFIKNRRRDTFRKALRHDKEVRTDDENAVGGEIGVPGDSFNYAWARQVIGQSLRRMRTQCMLANRKDIWGVFRNRTVAAALLGSEPKSCVTLSEEFGLKSPRRVNNILVTGHRMFARIIRSVISGYEREQCDIDAEILDLWQAVRQPQTRIARMSKFRD